MLNVEWMASSRGSSTVILNRRSYEAEGGMAEDGEGSQDARTVLKPGFSRSSAT
jgi:hypothetical protein